MANKYIIHGATYNGDGTSAAESTSNGGTGAWNNINILTGAAPGYGSIDTGNVVHIRSKSAAGADILISSASQIFLGKSESSVTWVLDNGEVWPGINGTLTVRYTGAGQEGVIVFRGNNLFFSKTEHSWVVTASPWSGHYLATGESGAFLRSILFSLASVGSGLRYFGDGKLILINCKFELHSLYSNYGAVSTSTYTNKSELILINPTISFSNATGATPGFLVAGSSYGDSITVIGGGVEGAVALNGGYNLWNALGRITLNGFKYPNTCLISTPVDSLSPNTLISLDADEKFGAEFSGRAGRASSRKDNNFPTLNAQLPDALGTPWAWWLYPSAASLSVPLTLNFKKSYEEAAAASTVTLEMLVSDSFSELARNNCVLNVTYTNSATGGVEFASSYLPEAQALDTSSAGWSFSSYGPITFSKKKIVVQLPSAIKQYSIVNVELSITTVASATNKQVIVCPDFLVS